MTRLKRLERAVRRLARSGRDLAAAQEREDYWNQFGTNSIRARQAEIKRDKALATLDRAEVDAEEILRELAVEGL